MGADFRFGVTHIDLGALGKEFGGFGSIVQQQERHDQHTGHIVQTAGQEVLLLLVGIGLHLLDGGQIGRQQGGDASLQRFHLLGDLVSEHFLENTLPGTVDDVPDGGHDLQLRRTLVDGEDTGVTEEPLAFVFHDETGTAVNRHGIVGVLVGIFGGHTLAHRREGIGQTGILLQFGTLLGR